MPTRGDEMGWVKFSQVVLAFAEVGFDAIDERLFRAGDHEINLIQIRAVQDRRKAVILRFPLRT